VLAVVLAAPAIVDQVNALAHDIPQAFRDVLDRLHRTGLVDLPREQSAEAAPRALAAPKIVGAVVSALGGTAEVIGGFVIMLFIGLYGAAQPRLYRGILLSVAPSSVRSQLDHALETTVKALTRWMLGRLVAMIFVGVTSGVVFAALHIPLAFTLALLAGALTFVEYAGAIASAVPPVLLAVAQSPGKALAVLLLFTGLHVVEGYVLTPLLARASVRLRPVFTLSAQVILGALGGPIALTFSTPLLVVFVSAARAFSEARRT
jgi:predicted PurR-regulated permease PerM